MHLSSHRPSKRIPRGPAAAVAALLIVAGFASQATGAPSTKYFVVSATPTSVPISNTPQAVTFTLTNCGSATPGCSRASTQSLGSAHVTLPTPWSWGFNDGDTVTVSVSNTSKSSHWTGVSTASVTSAGTVIQLANNGTSSAYALAPGEQLTFTAQLTPTPGGVAQTTTQAKQSNDFSGTGNDFLLVGTSPTITIGAPDHLEFGVPPQTVQVSTASTDMHYMCDAQNRGPTVRVVDRFGSTVTWIPPTTITLADTSTSGLRLNGSTTLSATTGTGASGGIASFGSDCTSGLSASTLGAGYMLGATATVQGQPLVIPASLQMSYDVLQFYALCPPTCSTPSFISSTHTGVQASADTTGAAGRFAISVGVYNALGGCNGDGNPNRQLVSVDLQDHTKTVTLKWDKKTVQWFTNNGTPFWDVCMWATYPFTVKGGGTSASTGNGWYAGTLPPCAQTGIVTGTDPCVANLYKLSAEEYAVISLPNVPGDPQFR